MTDSEGRGSEKTYAPIGAYLGKLPPSMTEVVLTFAQVEEIIGRRLPNSARKHREWWANQQAGSRAYHWLNVGFKTGPVDLIGGTVHFYRDTSLTPRSARPRAMTLQEIVAAVNKRAQGRSIGGLPKWRKDKKGLDHPPSNGLFNANTVHDNYAFHVGGRTELQFNIGFEPVAEQRKFRHGVAFSLEPSRSLPDVTVLRPKIDRFNKYVRVYADAFDGFQMWHWIEDDGRSDTYSVRPIPPELIRKGVFIFIGKLQPANAISVDAILGDFDRLLPVYEYVEGDDKFPARTSAIERHGLDALVRKLTRAGQTSYERIAKKVDVDLRHNRIADALADYLAAIHGEGSITKEAPTRNRKSIDVVLCGKSERVYYEVKTHTSARACIREALGQLLEYSFWPGEINADRLVVVGDAVCDEEAKVYIERLRKRFSLTIEYQQFDLNAGKLI